MTKAQLKTLLGLNIMLPVSIHNDQGIENITEIFNDYMECGANILIAPTHLANSNDEKKEIIEKTLAAASDKVFAAGIITPANENLSYESYTSCIKKEAEFLSQNGVSMIFLNNFSTLKSAKYAFCAAKEACELPLCIGLDFNRNGCLKDGTKAINALLTLQALGADAIGTTGNSHMETVCDVISVMSAFSAVPLFTFCNLENGMTETDFAEYIPNLVNSKCAMIGIAVGSGERSLIEISKAIWQFNPHLPDFESVNAVCSRTKYVIMDFKDNVIGDNKNILEIKIDDENTDVSHLLEILNSKDSGPVCFNVKDPEILRRLLYEYVGRPAVISDEYGEIAAKEIGAVILSQSKNSSDDISDTQKSDTH